jgi:M6 family metalloprotease-like protein
MRRIVLAWVAVTTAAATLALEPPRRGEIRALGARGDLSERLAFATRLGNHRLELVAPGVKAKGAGGLPTTGTVHILALLVDFPDTPRTISAAVIDAMLFGTGSPANYPRDSLRQFYLRSSYGKLDIQGSTLGWYTTKNPRASYTDKGGLLIKEIFEHFDTQGHDFSVYDNDGDGEIDSFNVFWSGDTGEWATFWWGCTTSFRGAGGDPDFRVDGKALGKYTWQPEDDKAACVIHETGHMLGLPDYYDYDATVGPGGGLGDMDVMGGERGDHNGYSKWLLGWLTPQYVTGAGATTLTLPASATSAEGTVVIGASDTSPNGEFFMIQNRSRVGNDSSLPGDGVLVFHVDGRLGCDGATQMFNNSTTEHKLIRVVEADNGDDIERGTNRGEAGDYFRSGGQSTFGPFTSPASDRYNGSTSDVLIDAISAPGQTMTAVARILPLAAAKAPVVKAPLLSSDTAGLAPRIEWQPVAGAGGYQVELHSGANRLYRATIPAGGSTHTVPPGSLSSEGTYSASVRALGNGSSVGAGPFERTYFSTRPCGPARWVVRSFPDLCCGATLDHPGLAYDPTSETTVLFGGSASTATYEYDGTSWRAFKTVPAPTPRRYPIMAADPTGGGVLLFGGLSHATGTGLNDTWRYSPLTRKWQQLAPGASPPGSWIWTAAADTGRGVVLLVSSIGTWEWNGSGWRNLGVAAATPPVYDAAVAYDARRRRTVMFGGVPSSGGALSDATWEFDGSVWKQAGEGTRPPARSDHAMVYQQAAGVTLLLGGWSGSGQLYDLWAWDGSAWSEVPVCDSRAREQWANYAAYDAKRDVVVTGGRMAIGAWGEALATWELEVESPLPTRSVRRHIRR